MIFIFLAGMMVIGLWAVTIMLAVKSGKGILSLFARKRKHQWLSPVDTITQYGSDHTDTID